MRGGKMSEKLTAIILPSWNPDEPRFIVETCEHRIAEDREFRNNTCVYNQRLKIAYNVEEIVEVLNNMGDKIDKLEEENGSLKKFIKDNFDGMIDSKMVIDDE